MKLFLAVSIICVTTACENKPDRQPVDLDNEKRVLLAMHAADRQAHFDTDAKALFENSLDTFTWVGNAQIVHISRADVIKRFEQNLSGVTYSKWDDLTEPIVEISNDGTLAWVVTRTEVRRTKRDEKKKFWKDLITLAS